MWNIWFDCLLALKDNPKYLITTIVYKDEAGREYPVTAIVNNPDYKGLNNASNVKN